MLMSKEGMILVGLIFFSSPTSARCVLEETVRKVIMGFQQKDVQLVDSLIDRKTDLYALLHCGVSMDVENLK